MKKLISCITALAITVGSMSVLTAGAEGVLSYTNEFSSGADVWKNANTPRGTVSVDAENGWLVVNNQAASEQAGSMESFYGATMDFSGKYIKINTKVKFDDFVSQKGFTFRPSGTVQWATVSGGVLSFMGVNTGKTLTVGEWYDFEFKMDSTGGFAYLTVTDKNGIVYESGKTAIAGTTLDGVTTTQRLGVIVFQDSKKATDAVITIDRYELSEITKAEMYPPEVLYNTEFTAEDAEITGGAGKKGAWGYDSSRGTITIDTENEVMNISTLTTMGGGLNAEYSFNNTLAFAEKEMGFEINTKVKFDDFNSAKQFNVRGSAVTTYANIYAGGSLAYTNVETGVILNSGVCYDFKFMADPVSGKAYFKVTDENGETVFESTKSDIEINAETIKAMDNLTRTGFFVAKNTNTVSSFEVDAFEIKEILPTDIPEKEEIPEEPEMPEEPVFGYSDDFKTADNIDSENAVVKGKWAIDQKVRGNVKHDATQNDGVIIITNNNASGGVVKAEYIFDSALDVSDKAVAVKTKVKFDDLNSSKSLLLRINNGDSTAVAEFVSVYTTGELVFIGNSTGVTLSDDMWYEFIFSASNKDGKLHLKVIDENENTVYDSSNQVLDLTKTYAAMFSDMKIIARAGFGIAKSEESVITVDDYSVREIDASDIPDMLLPDPDIIISDDFKEGVWKNTHSQRGTVTHDAVSETMIITNKQIGSEGFADAGSMNADYYLQEAVNVEDSVLEIKSVVKFDDFNTDKGLELRIKDSSSEDAIYKSTHQYASVAPETGELIFMGTYTGKYLDVNKWYEFTFVMNTEIGYGNLLVKDKDGNVIYDSVGKTLNWATVRAEAYNQMISIERIGFTVFSSEECDSTMTVDSCVARLVTDEDEIAGIDFISSVHASLPMLSFDEEMTTITATTTKTDFAEEGVSSGS